MKKPIIATASFIAAMTVGLSGTPTHAASPRAAVVTNPRLLSLGADAFPGLTSDVPTVDVYKTAADIDGQALLNAQNDGELYRSLGSYGSMKEEVLVSAGAWGEQLIELFATAFPSSTTAQRAFSADVANLNHVCIATAQRMGAGEAVSCAYSQGSDTVSDTSEPSAILSYRVSHVGTVEYIVTSFIEAKTAVKRAVIGAAEPLATRTVTRVAQSEAGHLQHLLSLSVAPPISSASVSPAPKPRPGPVVKRAPVRAPAFTVRAWVSPNAMPYNAYPTLYVQSQPGASCSAGVVYSTGRSPVSFDGSPQTLPANGTGQWSWHEETKGYGGTATVDCTYHGQNHSATASFAVQ